MAGKRAYTHVLWDWNGTLFDDVDWCMQAMNTMLARRDMKALADRAAYHRVFGFPIIDYYKNVGFDFDREPFAVLAREYMDLYHSGDDKHCRLHDHALPVLQELHSRGIAQVVLSASELGNLLAQLGRFPIQHYFDEILGLGDVYANSKVAIGLAYMARQKNATALLVGDTTHDAEVAKALNIDCLLVAKGHQGRTQLLTCGVPMVDDIWQVLEYIT